MNLARISILLAIGLIVFCMVSLPGIFRFPSNDERMAKLSRFAKRSDPQGSRGRAIRRSKDYS